MMKRLCLLLMLINMSTILPAQEDPEPVGILPVSLASLATAADLVALVRVLDTDYEYTREFPSGGTAFLRILIPYKVSRPLEDIIDVYDEGLYEEECYFDNPTVLEEGRRYLVFLKFSDDVDEQYNGLDQGCKLEVLVQRSGQYALRYPINGISLADDFSSHVTAMDFQDEYAFLEDEEISPDERNELMANGYLIADDRKFRYTHGINISEIRKLMGPEGLTLDRSLK